jgi:hypothetical protein
LKKKGGSVAKWLRLLTSNNLPVTAVVQIPTGTLDFFSSYFEEAIQLVYWTSVVLLPYICVYAMKTQPKKKGRKK